MFMITHQADEVETFFAAYANSSCRILFLGTVGFNDAGNYFPSHLSGRTNIDYRFLIEERPVVPTALVQAGDANRAFLHAALHGHSVEFAPIQIMAEDAATTAGRNAVAMCAQWLNESYTDIVLDTTSMSRGVCFPIAKQVIEFARRHNINPHILVAERDLEGIHVQSMSSDVACYMHGFQGDMDTDTVSQALKMWVPQLSENALPSLERIFSVLKPEEVCPVLPFPSFSPRRADELVIAFQAQLLGNWDTSLLDAIYAHEADPTDVYESIKRLHLTREKVFKTATSFPARTVLTPSGWRVGSIGMLLAALELDLPVMYAENIGYTLVDGVMPTINMAAPPSRWHIWLPLAQ